MSKTPLALLLLVTVVAIGCRATRTKNITEAGHPDSTTTLLAKNYFTYDWFAAHAKITVLNDEGKTDFAANIRAKNDSAIWISITPGLGIEVARVLMTRDSVYVIDRLNKKFYSRGYDMLQDYTAMPVDLETMENILAGVPIYFNAQQVKSNRQDTLTVLTSERDNIVNALYLNPDYTLRQMHLTDSAMGKSLNLTYRDYNRDNIKPFALNREITLNDEKHTNVFVSFSRVKVNEPQKMPFNVKEKYD